MNKVIFLIILVFIITSCSKFTKQPDELDNVINEIKEELDTSEVTSANITTTANNTATSNQNVATKTSSASVVPESFIVSGNVTRYVYETSTENVNRLFFMASSIPSKIYLYDFFSGQLANGF